MGTILRPKNYSVYPTLIRDFNFGQVTKVSMVDWHRFTATDFEYDFENDKLSAHGLTFEEAVECFFSDFQIRRNKSYRDRYQLIGRTIGGRRLKDYFST